MSEEDASGPGEVSEEIEEGSTASAEDAAGVPSAGLDDDEGLEEGRVPEPLGVPEGMRGRIRGLASGAWANMSGTGGGLRQFALPAAVFLTLIASMLLFHEILMPFIMALVIVYLMEPIVSRAAVIGEERRGLPRWAAVISVYVMFFGVVTTSLVLIAPRFVSEIVSFGETVPEELQAFRAKQLPEYNARLKRSLAEYLPQFAVTEGVSESVRVEEAWGHAAVALGLARQKAAGVPTAVAEARRAVRSSARMKVRWDFKSDPLALSRTYRVERDEQTKLDLASPRRLSLIHI